MEGAFRSERGLQLSSVDWLLAHHKAKEAERLRMVDDLHLQPGDHVLDSASGPGLWSRMFAEKVKPDGRVVGLDFSPELIDHARTSLAEDPLGEVVDLVHGDFNCIPFRDHAFDVVFLGNCFCYLLEGQELIQEHKRVTRRGGRVISKEFDGAVAIYHPVDPAFTMKVLAAAARRLQEDPDLPPFDNFVGRRMHGMFRKAGFASVSTRTYAIQKLAPLNEESKRYLAANADWYGRMATPYLSGEERGRWKDAFDPDSDSYILDREDFYFAMIETVTVGTV